MRTFHSKTIFSLYLYQVPLLSKLVMQLPNTVSLYGELKGYLRVQLLYTDLIQNFKKWKKQNKTKHKTENECHTQFLGYRYDFSFCDILCFRNRWRLDKSTIRGRGAVLWCCLQRQNEGYQIQIWMGLKGIKNLKVCSTILWCTKNILSLGPVIPKVLAVAPWWVVYGPKWS